MDKMTPVNLETAFMKARAAVDALETHPDNGTCNLDTPVLFKPPGVKESALHAMAARHGMQVSKRLVFGRLGYSILFRSSGMADRNTKMAEAARECFKNAGFDVTVLYVID